MVDYHIDLEKRIQLQDDIILKQNEQIKQLETALEECSFVYKVDWENDEYQIFNYTVSRTFEGACSQLLLGIRNFKEALTSKNIYSLEMVDTLSCWKISKEYLLDHAYFREDECVYVCENILYVSRKGYVTDYCDKKYHKIFCKVRKKLKGKNETT